jgi:nucleoside phosphorylase
VPPARGDAASFRVAVLAPMRAELHPLLHRLGLPRARAGDAHRGALAGIEVTAATAGVGTASAAGAAERILDAAGPDHLVIVGIAGAIGRALRIGDLVVPERVIDLASDSEHRPSPLGDEVARGTLVTSDRLIADPREIAELARRGAVAIDMETAAIAAVCERRSCPWSVFRAISDRAGEGGADESVLGLLGPDGEPDLAALARLLLAAPRRVAQLLRLARGLRLATRTAAAAAARAIERGPVLPLGHSAVV